MNVDASFGKFTSDHSSMMCEVISQCLKSTADSNGRINWQEVCAILNSKLHEKEGGNAINYSEIDCHKHWRLLAYGEVHVDDDKQVDMQKVFQHSEDSDEENFYMYPLQAIARRAVRSKRVLIPTSEQCTAAKMTDKITCDMKTNSTIDSVPNGDSGEVQTNNHNSSSAIQGECGTDLGVNSTTDNSDSSRDPLLRKPKQHHSRNTKMFVSSQIHSGEITMQHILFTFAKDPFLKVSNETPTGLCLSSLAENQSFATGKRLIARANQQPGSRAYQQAPARAATAPQAPSASSSSAAFERSKQTQSSSIRQSYPGSTPSLNPFSAFVPGLASQSTGASPHIDLTEKKYAGYDSQNHRNAVAQSNSSSSSGHMNGTVSHEIEYGNGNVVAGMAPTAEQLASSVRQTEDRHALHQQQQRQLQQYEQLQRQQYSIHQQQQQQQHQYEQLQQQQHQYELLQQQQQQQRQQQQKYQQDKQQSEQHQYQKSNYWSTVMERTNGSPHQAHPIMTRDELTSQYHSISSIQNDRNFKAVAENGNTLQKVGGPSFGLTGGATSSSGGSRAHSTADQNSQMQHSNGTSAFHSDSPYHQQAFIPSGDSAQMSGANHRCPSPQSKNSSNGSTEASEKKRKREKLQYVNFVKKSQSDPKRPRAASDSSSDHFQDISHKQIDRSDRDQQNRSSSHFKDGSHFTSSSSTSHDSSYNAAEHRHIQNGSEVASLRPLSQSIASSTVHHPAATISSHRYPDDSGNGGSGGSSSSHTNLDSQLDRPLSSNVPQSDNGLAVLLLAISGTPSKNTSSSLSLPALDLDSFTSNMDKHFTMNHSEHQSSNALQSHNGGGSGVKLMDSPSQLLDPL